jgi:hypothetical protein
VTGASLPGYAGSFSKEYGAHVRVGFVDMNTAFGMGELHCGRAVGNRLVASVVRESITSPPGPSTWIW